MRRGGLLALACLALAACQAPPSPAGSASPPAATTPRPSTGFPRTVTDGAGRSVRLPVKPARIVSQTLGTDEILFALVPPERLVGLSTLARDPKYSNVVEIASRHPAPLIESAEDVVRLKPDLVFIATYSRAEVATLLESTGATVYRLASFDDLDGVMANIRQIGEAIGEEAAAARLVQAMAARLEAIATRRAGHRRPRVLSYSGGFTAGRGTTFDDIVRRAGGSNEAAARGIDKFPKISAEQVMAWDPEVLVSGYMPGEADLVRRRLMSAPGLEQTTAVRRRQIVVIEERRFLAVSQYVVDAVDELASSLDTFEGRR